MKTIEKMIDELNLDNKITLDDIPNIDLYMDQVIQLFEQTYGMSKRTEKDKIMTKTMINNYAKAKVFFPIHNKKYSKEHLILISMIYHLKGSLSINDIKSILDPLNSDICNKNSDLEIIFTSYLHLFEKSVSKVKEDVTSLSKEVNDQFKKLDDTDHLYLEKILLVSTLVNISNFYRRIAEKVVDEL